MTPGPDATTLAGAPPATRSTAWAGLARSGAGLAVVAGAVLLASLSGVLRPLDEGLAEMRFRLLQRPASQTLTTVEIDAASLRAAGRWPWGRERFATAIARLQDAGAEVVAFDVDFSARSSPQGDRALQAAIERRPGTVVLPTFVQRASQTADGGLVETAPLATVSADAALASVNVPVDADGKVRRYAYGFAEGGGYRQSIAGVLAGTPAGGSGAFLIDYGIRAQDLPHLSFEDVYRGRFDPELVRGRAILIGATALELGDEFATPRYGTLSGVNVHALAYESLRAGRALRGLNPWATLALAGLVAVLLRPRRRMTGLKRLLSRHFAVAAGAVVLPLWLQALAPVSLDVAPILLAQALCLIWSIRAELDRRAVAIVRERESALLHLAMHEPETELPNRRALSAQIAGRLADPDGGALAVIAVGIDRYPTMRGAIGYGLATRVVQALAARLEGLTGEAGVAHLSTSVLGLALSAPSPEALRAAVQRLEAMAPSFQIDDHAVDAFVRLGVAHMGRHGETAEGLLEHATIALDQARQLDRRVVAFDAQAFVDPSLNLALMSEMRRGLKAGELSLHYQPKVAPGSGEVTGVEALVRWRHPTRGPIPPDEFIGAAEETGNIRALTEWALDQVLVDRARLHAAGQNITVALNVSARLLADRGFRRRALKTVAARPGKLCFEITESAVIENPQAAMAAIAAYRDAGIGISIDDYGTGLSSLAYLKMIDADELKVDKSLVTGLADSARDRLILKSTIDLAHSLGMSVVAEGVEDEAVRKALRLLNCDTIQGYLVSPPLPMGELLAFLEPRPAAKRRARAA